MPYLDIHRQLELLMAYPGVWKFVCPFNKPYAHVDGLWDDIRDGSLFRNHPFFQNHPNALIFLPMADEAKTGKKKETKLHFVFLTLGNIPSEYRCHVEFILPVAAIPSSYIEKIGSFRPFLYPIIEMFNEFYDGVELNVGGVKERFFGALLACIGDNLELNPMSGRTKRFTVPKVCRGCLAEFNELDEPDVSRFVVLSWKEYEQAIQGISSGASNEKGI